MNQTVGLLVLSFGLSLISASFLADSVMWLMVLKLLAAVGFVIGFAWMVVQHGRKIMWWAVGLVLTGTVLALLAALLGWIARGWGAVALWTGEFTALNLWAIGEATYRLSRRLTPIHSMMITAGTASSGLLLGWLLYFWFFWLFRAG